MKQKKKAGHGEIVRKVFDGLADLLIATKMTYHGNIYFALGKIIKALLEEKEIKKKQIKKTLYDLEQKKFLYLKKRKDEVYVYIREKGRKKILQYSIKKILDFKKKTKKWSGKWFLVFFDVPENQRNKRDHLRNFLRFIGFYPYQKSVYIFPYDCQEEIALVKKIIEGGKYLSYIVAEKIEDEKKFKNKFGLYKA